MDEDQIKILKKVIKIVEKNPNIRKENLTKKIMKENNLNRPTARDYIQRAIGANKIVESIKGPWKHYTLPSSSKTVNNTKEMKKSKVL